MPFFRKKFSAYISEVTGEDLPHVAAIHSAGFRRGWNSNEFGKLLSSKDIFCLVCRTEGKLDEPPMGFVVCRGIVDEAEIISIATAKKHRRKGVARLLMEATIRKLQADRRKSLFLEVDEANAPAIALYKQLGFVLAGRREGYYSQRNADDVAVRSTALVMFLQL